MPPLSASSSPLLYPSLTSLPASWLHPIPPCFTVPFPEICFIQYFFSFFITLVPCPSFPYEFTIYSTNTCFCQHISLLLLLCFIDFNPSLPRGWLEEWLSTSTVADLGILGIIWNDGLRVLKGMHSRTFTHELKERKTVYQEFRHFFFPDL